MLQCCCSKDTQGSRWNLKMIEILLNITSLYTFKNDELKSCVNTSGPIAHMNFPHAMSPL